MEKINTPIMAHIEFLKSELYPSMPVGQRVIIKRAIKNAESLLSTERDMMTKIHCSGQVCTGGKSDGKVAESCLKEKYNSYK